METGIRWDHEHETFKMLGTTVKEERPDFQAPVLLPDAQCALNYSMDVLLICTYHILALKPSMKYFVIAIQNRWR